MVVSSLAFVGLLGAAFSAGFVDSIAGGGGLIMLPALLLSGLPPKLALGTNKLNSTLGTSMAVWNFYRKGKLMFPLILVGMGFMISGGVLGSRLALSLNEAILAKVIIAMLPIGIIATMMRKKTVIHKNHLTPHDKWLKIPLICLVIGTYDGFFGPGAGSFLAIAFYFFLHLNLIEATANAKVFNLLSNFGALVSFILGGKVIYALGLPLAGMGMLGNYVGSHMVMKKGDGIIKLCLIGVLVLLLTTLIVKYII